MAFDHTRPHPSTRIYMFIMEFFTSAAQAAAIETDGEVCHLATAIGLRGVGNPITILASHRYPQKHTGPCLASSPEKKGEDEKMLAETHDCTFPEALSENLDRRNATRSLTVCKVVKVERDGDEALARCRNISDNGMKLEVSMPLSLMEPLRVELAPGLHVDARVVWTNGDECGLFFDRSIDCGELLRRSAEGKSATRSPRVKSSIPALIHAEGRARDTMISNISQRGMRITHRGEFQPGLNVKVMLQNGLEKCAVVRWTHENFAGLFLLDHLSVEEVEELRRGV